MEERSQDIFKTRETNPGQRELFIGDSDSTASI